MRTAPARVAALAASALLVVACAEEEAAGPDELDLVASGTLTVCADVPQAPFSLEDPDSELGYRGFDIDLVVAIAEELDLEVEVVDTSFEGLTSGATKEEGTCDLAAAAMTITEERAERLDFSDPYYDTMQSLLVADDGEISGMDELVRGAVVGVQSGTTGEAYAEEHVPGGEVRPFDSTGDLFVALRAGEVDAVVHDKPVTVAQAADTDAKVVEEYVTGESYGFALLRGREDGLLPAVNEALAEVREDGTYDEIYDEYFGSP